MRQKKEMHLIRGCMLFMALYLMLAVLFYYAAGTQLYERRSKNEIGNLAGIYTAPELTREQTVKQVFLCEMDELELFNILFCTFARENSGQLQVVLRDETTQTQIYRQDLRLEELADGQTLECMLPKRAEGVRGHVMAIELSSDGVFGNAAAPWCSDTEITKGQQLYVNNEPVEGRLCFGAFGLDHVWTGPHYWQLVLIAGVCLCAGMAVLLFKQKYGKKSFVLTAATLLEKYRFLIRQLVSRDFNIKYKRSVLGALWSFVNPLLTMCVQYVVFSTLFKMDIPNYPVYLLSGIVLFNFFTEATNMALYAITGNASLITKVYVPKYIYPVSKVLSTGINLLISLLPLLCMCLATGIRVTKAWLLLPFALFCLVVFCIGMGFLLSAVMVFFRDMQFILNVLTMVWTYATPVFYPETILSEEMRMTLEWNPMYQYITFLRTVILEGISPEPRLYLKCACCSALFLVIGFAVFRRSQDRFIFYI